MNQEIALWALGGLAAVVGSLSLVILNGVRKTSDDTNRQVNALTVDNASMKASHIGLTSRVDALDRWRVEEQQRQLHAAEKRIAELEREREDDRRDGPSDRRTV